MCPASAVRAHAGTHHPPVHFHAETPPSDLAAGGDVGDEANGELAANKRGGASLLSSPDGQIEITGGHFNAVSGNLVTVQVNLNGLTEGGRTGVESASTEIEGCQTQDNRNLEAARSDPTISIHTSNNSVEQQSTLRIPPQSINDIYYRGLASKKRGSPLWIPGTNNRLPINYQRNGLMIGDTGMITDRGFYDSLFNITLRLDDPLAINTDELPFNFSPLKIRPTDIQGYSEFGQGSYLSSASIRNSYDDDNSSGLIFESSASEGAILTLPDGSNSEDLGNKKKLRDYLIAHGEEMYRCALIGHGRIITNGDLRVVTGYDKAKNWGMAAFSNSSAQADSFRLKFRPRAQGRIGRTHSWESSGTAEVKTGPDIREIIALRMGDQSQQDVEYENQSVFVRTENITLQKDIWKKLLSEIGEVDNDDERDTPYFRPSSPTRGSSGDRSSAISSESTSTSSHHSAPCSSKSAQLSSSANTLTVHPSNSINEILLKFNPSARMAITGDQDWISVLREEDSILPPPEQLWSRIMESFDISEEDDVVFLEKLKTEVCFAPPHLEANSFYFSDLPQRLEASFSHPRFLSEWGEPPRTSLEANDLAYPEFLSERGEPPDKYTISGSSSWKKLPTVVTHTRSRSPAFSGEDRLDMLPPNPTEMDTIEQKRRLNTIAARWSRKRKLDQFQMMEKSRNEERQLKEQWQERANAALLKVRTMGVKFPDFPPDQPEYSGV